MSCLIQLKVHKLLYLCDVCVKLNLKDKKIIKTTNTNIVILIMGRTMNECMHLFLNVWTIFALTEFRQIFFFSCKQEKLIKDQTFLTMTFNKTSISEGL